MKKSIFIGLIMGAVCSLQAQNMGIGIANPSEKLDVDGALKIGYTTNANEGAIRYNPTTKEFEGFDGTLWKAFSPGSVSTDNLGNHIASQNLNMNSFRITSLFDPTSPQHAATKAYVDNEIAAIPSGADNLGDHAATQNVELTGNWLSNDGDDEGVFILDNGNVGIGTSNPTALFSVNMIPLAAIDQSNTSANNNYPFATSTVSQTITAGLTGILDNVKIQVNVGAPTSTVRLRVYQGVGAGRVQIGSVTNATGGSTGQNKVVGFDFSGVNVVAGQQYTLQATYTSGFGFFRYRTGNPYAGGASNQNANHDLYFSTSVRSDAPGFQVTDTDVLINDYKLPQADGNASQVIVTDGAGNLSWSNPVEDNLGDHQATQNLNMGSFLITNLLDPTGSQHAATKAYVDANGADDLGNHISTQNIELSGNWLSNDGDDEGIRISSAGRVGIGVTAGTATSVRVRAISGDANYFKIQSPAGTDYFSIADNGKVSLLNGTGINEFSTDGTLAGNSNDALPTERAVKTYVDSEIASIPPSTDNLGNHSATQNVALNGYWISNDGDNEGFAVENTGEAGINFTDVGTTFSVWEPLSGAHSHLFEVFNAATSRVFSISDDGRFSFNLGSTSSTTFAMREDLNGSVNVLEVTDKNNGELFTIDNVGRTGVREQYNNVTFNVKGISTDLYMLNVEKGNGTNLFNVDDNGVTRITIPSNSPDNMFVIKNNNSNNVFTIKNNNGKTEVGTSTTNAKLTVDGDGAKSSGGNNWSTFSDERLKKDIMPYDDGLDEIMQIRPVRYYYNNLLGLDNQDKEEFGIIAQELKEVAPYMVSEAAIEVKGEDKGKFYMVNNGAMTYMLVNGMQEQQELIEQLQAENAALKANEQQMQARLEAIERELGMNITVCK